MRVLWIIPCVFLFACDPLKGVLSVKQDISLKLDQKNTPRKVFSEGTYKAELDLPKKTKAVLTITDQQKKSFSVAFAIPKDRTLPGESGEFYLSATENGQDYDIGGRVDTNRSESRLYREHETCTYEERVRVCRQVPGEPGQPPRTVCEYEWIRKNGWQYVEYRVITETKNISFMMGLAGRDAASFSGEDSDSYKNYEYRAPCR